jgi:exodeoxyribonuclease VII small subunit
VVTVASNGTVKRQVANGNGQHAVPDTLPRFEEALDELDKAVEVLERGDLELDEAIALFERGMSLAHVCQEALDRAELHVRVLVESEDGSGAPSDVPFEPEAE